jgi:ABC-2 type transport system ATP-binding protein
MDEAERCTDVGLLQQGRLLAKGSRRELKEGLRGRLLEIHVEPVMEAMRILRDHPNIEGVELLKERLRIHSQDPGTLLAGWLKSWPYSNLTWLGHNWVEPNMEDVFMAYSLGDSWPKREQIR